MRLDEWRYPEGCARRALQRERLRDHLAEDDVEVRQHRDGHDARHRVRGNPPSKAERTGPRFYPPGDDMLAVHAQAKARQRHANLGGGDVPVAPAHVVEDRDDAPGAAVSPGCEMLEAGARRADNRKLRGDKEPVRARRTGG